MYLGKIVSFKDLSLGGSSVAIDGNRNAVVFRVFLVPSESSAKRNLSTNDSVA